MIKYITDVGIVEYSDKLSPVTKEDDIVDFGFKNKIEKVGDGEDEYILVPTEYEVSRKNRAAYINSFNDQVGLKAIEKQLLVQELQEVLYDDGIIDLTKIPDDPVKLRQWIIDSKQKYYNSGIDLGTVEQAAGATQDEIMEAVKKVLAANQANGGEQK